MSGEEREVLLDRLATSATLREWLPARVADDSAPSLVLLMSVACHIRAAFHSANYCCARCAPPPDQGPDVRVLEIAERRLWVVAEREPDWGEPWFGLFLVATMLGAEPAVTRPLFDETLRRDPWHFGTHSWFLTQLGSRHGGSDEDMHAFAYGAMTHAPGGSALGALVPYAHLESLIARPSGCFSDPLITRQLHHAADQSVRHPDYRRGPHWVLEHNLFALMFTLAGEQAAARDMFRILRGWVWKDPWGVMGRNPLRAYRRARHRSGVW